MSAQRKLNALLFELQTAQTPLARARVLARSWRTLRELSPTDRKLLARHAGFDGAEELLEGLAKRKGGWGPAMLMEVLGNARSADASTVSEIVRGLRTPGLRKDALRRGADFAAELLAEPEEVQPVDGDGPADDGVVGEEPAEEAQLPQKVEPVVPVPVAVPDESLKTDEVLAVEPATAAKVPALEPENEIESETEPLPEPESVRVPHPSRSAAVDWSRWDVAPDAVSGEAAAGVVAHKPIARAPGASGRTTLAVLANLRRELSNLRGASVDRLRVLLAELPEGWARRRALAALLEGGVPADAGDALELIADFDRELDRRWCLGVLARRGDLEGAALDRGLDLLSSPSARRRILRACAS